MKKAVHYFLFAILIACNSTGEQHYALKPPQAQAVFTDTDSILKDFSSWYNYTYYNILLTSDFIALNSDSVQISKPDFLTTMQTGNFVAIKLKNDDIPPVYKLVEKNIDDQMIIATMRQMAKDALNNYQQEGTDLPSFSFTDIDNNHFTTNNTKGKAILLKAWFIKCTACVKEFPELNKLADQYSNRTDILFISIALDKREDLKKFLATNEFKYKVVPEQEDYLQNRLHIQSYPTHILVNTRGKIVKIANRIEEVAPFIEIALKN
ncbi:TlpA family protein disulfide reductase [Haoranjiania flava]